MSFNVDEFDVFGDKTKMYLIEDYWVMDYWKVSYIIRTICKKKTIDYGK